MVYWLTSEGLSHAQAQTSNNWDMAKLGTPDSLVARKEILAAGETSVPCRKMVAVSGTRSAPQRARHSKGWFLRALCRCLRNQPVICAAKATRPHAVLEKFDNDQ